MTQLWAKRRYAPKCQHCKTALITRSRGLCQGCYYQPAIRKLYQLTGLAITRGAGLNGFAGEPTAPTTAKPQTADKVAVFSERASRGEALHHPDDARHSNGGPHGVRQTPAGEWEVVRYGVDDCGNLTGEAHAAGEKYATERLAEEAARKRAKPQSTKNARTLEERLTHGLERLAAGINRERLKAPRRATRALAVYAGMVPPKAKRATPQPTTPATTTPGDTAPPAEVPALLVS